MSDQDLPLLNGPIVLPEDGKVPDQVVLLLHGVGADGQDLIGMTPYFQKVLPRAIFIAPNAPFPFDMAPFGYQWFSLKEPTPENRLKGTQEAAPHLDQYIERLLAENGMTEDQMALVGFSQGTMMALHVGLRRKRPLAGILGYSGALAGEDLLETEIASRPPVRLIHGDMDAVVPPDLMNHAVEHLTAHGVDVEGHMLKRVGHELSEEAIKLGMEFLAKCFGVDLQKIVADRDLRRADEAAAQAALAQLQAVNDDDGPETTDDDDAVAVSEGDGPADETTAEPEEDVAPVVQKTLEDHDISGLIPGIHMEDEPPSKA